MIFREAGKFNRFLMNGESDNIFLSYLDVIFIFVCGFFDNLYVLGSIEFIQLRVKFYKLGFVSLSQFVEFLKFVFFIIFVNGEVVEVFFLVLTREIFYWVEG